MQTPMKILLSAGFAAASMYYLDPSRGNERRADARARLTGWRDEAKEKMSAIGRKLPGIAEESTEKAEEITDQKFGTGSADHLRKQDRLQDRPLQG